MDNLLFNKKQKIILNTDVGIYSDDALSILTALRMDSIELLGVTTTVGDTTKKAKLAQHFLSYEGTTVNAYAGDSHITNIDKSEGVGNPFYTNSEMTEIEDKKAEDFIIDMVNKYPNEVIIVSIAKLTNISDAFKKCPDIINKVQSIYIMGSDVNVQGNSSETVGTGWNVLCDLEASNVVFDSDVKIHMLTSSVGKVFNLDKSDIEEIAKGHSKDSLEYYTKNMMMYDLKNNPDMRFLADPFTVFMLENNDLFECVDVKLTDEITDKGMFVVPANLSDDNVISVTVEVDNTVKSEFISLFAK